MMMEEKNNLANFHREKRPWGDFLEFAKNQAVTVKILDIMPNEMISLQHHQERDEFWYVIRGEIQAIVDDQKKDLKIGDYIYVKRGDNHRLINESLELAAILEISFGEFKENDEVMIEDKYQRKQGI